MAAQIHVGDAGTSFRATVLDEDDEIVDISTATVLQIWFEKPAVEDNAPEVLTRTATLVTDGTDGVMEYITDASDLDVDGRWRVQGYVEIGASQIHTDIVRFRVYPNIQ